MDELLFPLVVCCERCSSLPSLLEEELWSEEGLFAEVLVLKEAFDRRRRLKSLRKEGIASDCMRVMSHSLRRLCSRRKRSTHKTLLSQKSDGSRRERWKPRSEGRRKLRRENYPGGGWWSEGHKGRAMEHM